MINSKELLSEIKSKGITMTHIASELGITTNGLRLKIQNINEFKISEVCCICSMLKLDNKKRDLIFFAKNK